MIRPRYCRRCRRRVVALYEFPRFGFEAALAVVTCGLYLPIWLWRVTRSRWVCPHCASRV